jgi:hypothetical protein
MNKFQKDYESIIRDLTLGSTKKRIAITGKYTNFVKELQELIDDTKQMTV